MIWAARSDFRAKMAGNAEMMHERSLEMAGREERKSKRKWMWKEKDNKRKVDDYKTRVYDPAFGVR